jgi:hypothetical protein
MEGTRKIEEEGRGEKEGDEREEQNGGRRGKVEETGELGGGGRI